MTWIQRYKLRNYFRSSIWMLSAFGMAAGLLSVQGLDWIERRAGWQSGLDPDAARALFGTLGGAMFTFIVFMASILLLVLQIASAQLTPRVISVVHRDRVARFSLTLFAFTFTFTLAVLLRIHTTVPTLTTFICAYLCLFSLGVFLFLIEHMGKRLRPSGALQAVASLGHEVIQSVYPRQLAGPHDTSLRLADALASEPVAAISNPRDGVLLAFDHDGLVALARRAGCIVELVPQVGDFVAAGSTLFRILGGNGGPSAAALCQCVALGQERTMEQDPAFAFRIIVDIASKGLSPAINDPTTAVLAIDQLHHLLRNVGSRQLDEGYAHDSSGSLRFVYRTPNWEDFVSLAVTEIRHFGGTSIQVARRLRAMLENLVEVLPSERNLLLKRELALLQRSTGRFFQDPEDQALAGVSDLQGVGGKHPAGKARNLNPMRR